MSLKRNIEFQHSSRSSWNCTRSDATYNTVSKEKMMGNQVTIATSSIPGANFKGETFMIEKHHAPSDLKMEPPRVQRVCYNELGIDLDTANFLSEMRRPCEEQKFLNEYELSCERQGKFLKVKQFNLDNTNLFL